MTQNTHLKIDNTLNGTIQTLKTDYAKVLLHTTPVMIADEQGLIHGGFIFGAADFCAMLAVNDPLVVLAKSDVKFIAPVKLGESVIFEGHIRTKEGNRASVEVSATVGDKKVFQGVFLTATLDKHPLL